MKIKFVDGFFAEDITMRILNEICDGGIEISENPDYIFCSVGYQAEALKYDCPRIFLTGENIVPDFNCYDYAMGFHYMKFEDRYKRIPLYCFYENDYLEAIQKHSKNIDFEAKKFCNFVYSNGRDAIKDRDSFFYKLSAYKQVDSGGGHLNNVGGPVEDKISFQKNYKFSIAFENASVNGYTTEKILHAFAAGTIPIYYGNPKIAEEFNPKSFINCHNYDSFDAVIEHVKQVDQDHELYERYIREPIFVDIENRRNPLKEYKEYLSYILSQSPMLAMRRCNDCWGARLQEEKRRYFDYINCINQNTLKSKIIRQLI